MSSLGVGELTADIYTAEGHRTKCHTVSDMRDQGLVPIYKNSKEKIMNNVNSVARSGLSMSPKVSLFKSLVLGVVILEGDRVIELEATERRLGD